MANQTTTANTSSGKPNRLSNALLICIVLAVGTMAGAASFRHVHDWTMHNSPTGTPGWFGWANAVITELIPTAALIIIAQRRRVHGHIGYPMFLLIAAVSLSLTAQLAVALPTVFGWMVSALPSLAFFALSKLVFTQTHTTADSTPVAPVAPEPSMVDALAARITELESRPTTPAPTPVPPAPARAPSSDIAPGPARNSVTSEPPATRFQSVDAADETTSGLARVQVRDLTPPAAVPTVVSGPGETPIPTATINAARRIAESHQQVHAQQITAGQLAVRLRIDTRTAEKVLATLTGADQLVPAVNGYHHSTMDVPA
jgi:hypothetical protein